MPAPNECNLGKLPVETGTDVVLPTTLEWRGSSIGCDDYRIGVTDSAPTALIVYVLGRYPSGAMKFLKQCLTILFGVAFLNASALGAHLHQCFDGKEPRLSLHVYDGQANQHHAGTSEQHNDNDLDLSDQAFGKVLKVNSSMPPLSSGWIAPVVSRVETKTRFADADEPSVASLRSLPPPQRGPPA